MAFNLYQGIEWLTSGIIYDFVYSYRRQVLGVFSTINKIIWRFCQYKVTYLTNAWNSLQTLSKIGIGIIISYDLFIFALVTLYKHTFPFSLFLPKQSRFQIQISKQVYMAPVCVNKKERKYIRVRLESLYNSKRMNAQRTTIK
jgi:hypothetical protein